MEPEVHSREFFASLFPLPPSPPNGTTKNGAWHALVADIFDKQAMLRRPSPRTDIGLCPLADMGEYIIGLLHITCRFAESLVSGDLAIKAVQDQLNFMVHKDGEKLITYFDSKDAALKQIAAHLREAASACQQIWTDSPPYPESHNEVAEEQQATPNDSLPAANIERRSPVSDISEGDADMEDEYIDGHGNVTAGDQRNSQLSPDGLLVQLKSRGSGLYTCTYGMACKKGGVKGGQLRVFKRNSEFRMHMERHEKPYKCDLAGCEGRNKGFSRPDLLERHKRTVKHLGHRP